MRRALGRLAIFVVAHAKGVVFTWIALTLAGGALASQLNASLSNGSLSPPDSESSRAAAAIEHHIPELRGTSLVVAFTTRKLKSSPGPTGSELIAEHARGQRRILHVIKKTREASYEGPLTTSVTGPRTGRGSSGRELVSVWSVRLRAEGEAAQRGAALLHNRLSMASSGLGALVVLGATVGADRYSMIARHDVTHAERLALPLICVALFIAFLSAAAAALPILLGVASFMTTFGVLYLLALVTNLSVVGTNIASVLALGLSIDYSLFIVSRYRQESGGYRQTVVALRIVMETTGRAVALSGMSISVAMLSLFVLGIDQFKSIAMSGAIVSLMSAAAALTLLPATIHLIDGRARRRISLQGRARNGDRRLWRLLGTVVASRPLLVASVSLVAMVALSVPALSLISGSYTFGELPPSDSLVREASHLEGVFGRGVLSPIEVVTDRPLHVQRALSRDGNVFATRVIDGDGRWALVGAILRSAPDAVATRRSVQQLQARLAAKDESALVGGITAAKIDLANRVSDRTLPMVMTAIATTLVALMLGLRSFIIPVKAMVGTLLSVGAALGVLSIVFPPQESSPTIDFLVPPVLFAILFGLSIDYEVFLLSGVREAVDSGSSTADAVKTALAASARQITLAGICLVIVFIALETSSLAALRQLGLGVTIGVVVDVTVVRCLLVPSLTILVGRWNWWLPKVPRLGISTWFG